MSWLAARFELTRGGAAQNVMPMEGLRGIAVGLVFLVHYVALIDPLLRVDSSARTIGALLHAMGHSGVDLFFVLSGYLIYGSLIGKPVRWLTFMRRRVERIYPTFLVVFVIYLLASWAVPSQSKIPSGSGSEAAIYLLQNLLLLPGLFPIEPLIAVAWSLSFEMFFYIVIPLIVTVAHLRERPLARRALFFFVLAAAYTVLSMLFELPIRLIMFLAGILVFEVMSLPPARRPELPAWSGVAALVVALACMATPWQGPIADRLRIVALFFCFMLVCLSCFSQPRSTPSRLISFLPLRWLGNMSYSYYLVHGLALKVVFFALARFLGDAKLDEWFFWLALPPAFAVTLIVSGVLFLCVERPLSLVKKARAVGQPRLREG